jgi:hypothetical protein
VRIIFGAVAVTAVLIVMLEISRYIRNIKNPVRKRVVIGTIIFAIAGYYVYDGATAKIPYNRPKVIIKYEGKTVPSNIGEHTWFDSDKGGNSILTERSYSVGQKTSSITATAGSSVEVTFSSKPKLMWVMQWINEGAGVKSYETFGSEKKYEVTLPKEKGEYIFEVVGVWDETQNTSDIIRIKIE